MSDLEDLYREIILDHYRSPRNRGELEVPLRRAEGFKPHCGDEIVVYLELDDPSKGDEAVVSELAISGQGCSISQSSASMMSEAIKGRTVAEVHRLLETFNSMMSVHEDAMESGPGAESAGGPAGEDLGDLMALRGVVKFPVRIKCATLAWHTLGEALEQASSD
ncbi:MAG: SUF system NifU family Fe-S cluster assembly protein [Microthrixaceae bacterium]